MVYLFQNYFQNITCQKDGIFGELMISLVVLSMQSSQKIKTTFVYCRLPRKLKTDSGKILLPIKSKRHPFNSICHLPYKSNLVPFTPNPPKRTRLKNLLRNSLSGSKKDGGATQFSLRCKRNSHRYSQSKKIPEFFF